MWLKAGHDRWVATPEPFDKTDLSGPVASVIAVLAVATGLSREQAENVWSVMAMDDPYMDTIQGFGYACLQLNYVPKLPDGWFGEDFPPFLSGEPGAERS